MTNNHTDKEEYRSYALTPVPPKWELQEYIAAYIQEQDEKYFAWFLHYYENTLNRNVRKLMGQFFMPEHFSDIKQAYVIGMLKALRHYDISAGVTFVIYKERYAKREVMDYFRSSRTGFTAQSLAEFAKLRNISLRALGSAPLKTAGFGDGRPMPTARTRNSPGHLMAKTAASCSLY